MNANPTKSRPKPTAGASGSPLLGRLQRPPDAHLPDEVAESLADQDANGTQPAFVGDQFQPPAQRCTDLNLPDGGWLELRVWAEMFHDAQQQRIASTNRAERGQVDPAAYHAYIEAAERAEHICGLHLRRCYRRVVPAEIIAWQKAMIGIGEHLFARLLGHLCHPVWATPHHWEGTGASRTLVADPPFVRNIGKLWQYCGHGAPGRVRKGATFDDLAALGSPDLKMIVHLLAEACMKQARSPFRLVYEKARVECDPDWGQAGSDTQTNDVPVGVKLHTTECVRCGPSGKPAQPGSPWSKAHQHAHALRITGKEILRDLWIVSGGQLMTENQSWRAPGDNSRNDTHVPAVSGGNPEPSATEEL